MRSQILSEGSDLCERVLRKCRQASSTPLWGMLVFKEETPSVTILSHVSG